MWDRIVMIGAGTWFLCLCALVAGAAIARLILIPDGSAEHASRAQQLARYRTLIGFGLVAVLSYPYRSPVDTFDKVWGDFSISTAVALLIFVILSIVFWLGAEDDSRGQMRAQWPNVWRRVGEFVATPAAFWAVMWLCEQSANPEFARLQLILLGGFIGLLGMGYWCISCYWFGIGRVHPILPPIMAAATISAMTAVELHFDGPEVLPLRLWLLVNFAAVITTFGVCLIEICDAIAEARVPDGCPGEMQEQWPVAVAGILVTLLLTGVIAAIMTGTAERALCIDDLVKCTAQRSIV